MLDQSDATATQYGTWIQALRKFLTDHSIERVPTSYFDNLVPRSVLTAKGGTVAQDFRLVRDHNGTPQGQSSISDVDNLLRVDRKRIAKRLNDFTTKFDIESFPTDRLNNSPTSSSGPETIGKTSSTQTGTTASTHPRFILVTTGDGVE